MSEHRQAKPPRKRKSKLVLTEHQEKYLQDAHNKFRDIEHDDSGCLGCKGMEAVRTLRRIWEQIAIYEPATREGGAA